MEGTLSYNQRKVERGVARVVCSSGLPSASPEEVRRTFARYENRNRSSDRVSFQLSLNPDPASPGERLSEEILHATGVFITPGFIFGKNGEDYVRVSLCAPAPVLDEACARIREYIG